MSVRFARSAARHGVAHDRSRFVVDHCQCPLYSIDPTEADLVLFLGPDGNGVPLEVVGLELADGDLLVIHAMRLRGSYGDRYAEVMRCHDR